MACKGALVSMLGMSALGGVLSGAVGGLASGLTGGLANAVGGLTGALGGLGGITNQLSSITSLSGLTSGFSSVSGMLSGGLNPLSTVTSGMSGALGSLGSSLSDGLGSITGAIGDTFSSVIGGTSFLDGVDLHTGISGLMGAGPLQAMQTFNTAEAFSSISQGIAGPLADAVGANFGQAISSLTKALPVGGDFGNFLGAGIPDMQGLVTNGLSSLTNGIGDLPGFAGDLVNLGSTFDLGDVANFGNPGQLVSKLITSGGADITGITTALQEVGLGDLGQITNLASGQFNGVLNDALGMITNPEMIQNAQSILGSNLTGLTSMADFGDLSKVMQTSFDNIPFDTFNQFGEHLASLDLGTLTVPADLGNVVNAITTVDLPTILNVTNVVDGNAVAAIAESYLGGSGPYGSILTSDLIGSIGGFGFTKEASPAPVTAYKTAMIEMDTLGAFTTLRAMYNELSKGMAGDYLDVPGDADASTTITDPRDGSTHADLDSFVFKKIEQIRAEITSIAGNSTWSGAFGTARSNWTIMQKQIYDEKTHATKTDLQLNLRNNNPDNAYHFVSNMVPRAAKTDVTAIVDGMADAAISNKDHYGEYWRAFIAESKNRILVEPDDINWRGQDNTETVLL